MEVAERRHPLRVSEKPLRATGSGQEAASGEPGSIDPRAGENGQRGVERRIVRRFCLRCSMPCMPVESQAGNQVTWNHFFCGAQYPPSSGAMKIGRHDWWSIRRRQTGYSRPIPKAGIGGSPRFAPGLQSAHWRGAPKAPVFSLYWCFPPLEHRSSA
jgi:hypothetical protein